MSKIGSSLVEPLFIRESFGWAGIEGLDFVGIADKLMLPRRDASVQSRSQALLTEGLERYSLGSLVFLFPVD